ALPIPRFRGRGLREPAPGVYRRREKSLERLLRRSRKLPPAVGNLEKNPVVLLAGGIALVSLRQARVAEERVDLVEERRLRVDLALDDRAPDQLEARRFAERQRVAHAREEAGRVRVPPDDPGHGIGDGQRVLDVREGAIEDPEVVVQGPRVEDLDDRLDVGAVEEPEVA